MAKQAYKAINFNAATMDLIRTMNGIIREYMGQGFTLTVRQLYYQLVARDIIPNSIQSYKRITGVANDARLAGLMDWSAIEDRTREFVRKQRWESGSQIMNAAARGFHMDMWDNQPARVFTIIEKEALVGVLTNVCHKWDVPLLAARGYPSGTVLREFAIEDIIPWSGNQDIIVLHLGDHDPSGIDMTRDLEERIQMFAQGHVEVKRIALNMDQIEEYSPPPNPAKTTDSRFQSYMAQYGDESWELDALQPKDLSALVEKHIEEHVLPELWEERAEHVANIQQRIYDAATKFEEEDVA